MIDLGRPVKNFSEPYFSQPVLQPLWNFALRHEDVFSSPIFPVGVSVGTYFFMCILFGIMDMFLKHIPTINKLRLQPEKEITWKMVYRALSLNAMNNILFILPASISQWIWVPPTPLPSEAPSLFEFTYQTWAILMMFDFQYWVWHVCHHKIRWLYRNFHSIHHQYHSTFSWTTQYMHPWELFTLGLFATVNGWFWKCHPLTYWSFMALNIVMSVDAHSGYDIPFFPHHWWPFSIIYGGGPKHDMHHMRPMSNFQPFFSTFDRLFGWECPGMRANGKKTEKLLLWEKSHRNSNVNKHATELMQGSENGFLRVGQ